MAFREPIYFNDHTLKHQAGGMQEITPPSAEQSLEKVSILSQQMLVLPILVFLEQKIGILKDAAISFSPNQIAKIFALIGIFLSACPNGFTTAKGMTPFDC